MFDFLMGFLRTKPFIGMDGDSDVFVEDDGVFVCVAEVFRFSYLEWCENSYEH